jgi:hypothetical protein
MGDSVRLRWNRFLIRSYIKPPKDLVVRELTNESCNGRSTLLAVLKARELLICNRCNVIVTRSQPL